MNCIIQYVYKLPPVFILPFLFIVLGTPSGHSQTYYEKGYTPYSYYTGDSTYYLLPDDTIHLKTGILSEKMHQHRLAPGQTLYSLAQFYGLTIDEVYFYNPNLKNATYNIGTRVNIPIPNRAINRYKGKYFEESQYIPVCYVVEKGDNLYHISKRVFKLPIQTVKEKNNLENNILSVGQILNVGWMSIYGIPDSLRQFKGHPLWKQSFVNKRKYFYKKVYTKERKRQGPALWIKGTNDKATLVVMHRQAKEGAIIGVTNPMNNRTVYAKVVGKIPYAYPANIEVIVSPTVAQMLGVLDEKFYARIQYLK